MDFGISDYDREYSDVFGFAPDWRDLEDQYPHTDPFPDHYDAEFPDTDAYWHSLAPLEKDQLGSEPL